MSVVQAAVRATAISAEFSLPSIPLENTSLINVETPIVSDNAVERHNIKKKGMIVMRLIVTERQIISIPVVFERKRDLVEVEGRWYLSSASILSVPTPNAGNTVESNCTQMICVSVKGIGIS